MSQSISPDIVVETKPRACCQTRATSVAPLQAETAEPSPAPVSIAALISAYQPILVIAGAAAAGSLMMAFAHGAIGVHAMQSFMGLFLLPLAILKLFDIQGFAAAFARYDIVAEAWPAYGRIYPLAELALALLFLSGLFPVATNIAAVLIGAVGTVGIVRALGRDEPVRCACVGSTLDVPLGTVSVAENAGMAVMSAAMLAL
jgi:hypothetical protein